MTDPEESIQIFKAEKDIWCPSSHLRNLLREERNIRINQENSNVKARAFTFKTHNITMGLSESHFRFFFLSQFLLYRKLHEIHYSGIENIPSDKPILYVMKHRSWADITLHALAHGIITAGENPTESREIIYDRQRLRNITGDMSQCRYVMKETLLNLPVGLHLMLNGGIPVFQDQQTKALNTPGYDPKGPQVKKTQEKFSTWFQFRDSLREINSVLKSGGSIMIYGEATRVSGSRMGHLATRLISSLKKISDVQLVPVGSTFALNRYGLHYGPPTNVEDLRDTIATLSEIPKTNYL